LESLTNEKFHLTAYKVLKDFNIPDLETKLTSGELSLLFTIINNKHAYQIWTSKHINSFLPKQAISSKNIDNFIKSQMTHIEAVRKFHNFQYKDKQLYFRLLSTNFVLHLFLCNKKSLINILHDLVFAYWSNPIYYKNPFELIRNAFLKFIDIENFFVEQSVDFSHYKKDFANSFLNMHTFFHAFNITEKRIKTSFSIQVYQILCNLSLSKYKTKEITDTIMHHLDIDATINLKKIDNVQCIGKVDVHKIYGYDEPVIPIKFLDIELIQTLQKQQKQEALEANNHELVDLLDEIIESFNISSHMM